MKTIAKYIAATTLVSAIALSAGLANAQTPPADQTKPSTATEQPKDAAKTPAQNQTANQAKPDDRRHHRDPAKWQARHARMIDKLFAKYDPQHTGVITVDAFLKDADARFAKIDTKHQGFIDKDELAAYVGSARAPLADRILKRLDTNNDGKISKEEFEKPLRKRFALLDLNDDGKVTREEADLAGPASMLGPHHRDGDARRHHRHTPADPTGTDQK